MLTKTIGLSFGWAGVLFGVALAFAPGCGGTGETGGGERCTPNQQVSCDCKDGTKSVQVCAADGKAFEACECGTGGGGAGGGTGGTGGSGTTQSGLCGNGIQDPNECDPGEFACPQDCTGTGGAGGGTTTSSNTCEGVVTFAGLVQGVGPAWGAHPKSNGQTGYAAGVEICKAEFGADHPCTYEEMRKAEMANELSNIAQNTTTWIHRTTPEMVNNQMSQPGPGGRCNDWIYTTNHISDGEYSTFDQPGIPTYHLDNDTKFDGVDQSHTIAGDLDCGGVMRAIPCCFPACVP